MSKETQGHAAHATRSHLDFLVRSSNDAISETDTRRIIVSWNRSAELLYGYKAEEIIGKNIDLIVPKDKRDEIIGLFNLLKKGQEVSNFETERLDKRKNRISVSITVSPIKNSRGKLLGYSTITRDITEKKKLIEKLKLYAESINAAPSGIFIINLNGKITFANKAIERIYGLKFSEIKGKMVNSLNIDPTFAANNIFPALNRKGIWKGELTIKAKNNSTAQIWLEASAIKQNGNPIAYVGILRDVSQTKKLENLKSEFLSLAAHELKTPLTTLKLLGEAHLRKFKRSGKDEIKLSDINLINIELDKLNFLINDILDSSRIESGKLKMNFEVTNLNNLIRKVIKKLEIIYKNHRINLIESTPTNVVVDPLRIEQVLINLISNAVKYSPIFTKIEVGIKKQMKDKVEVFVNDEGEGIPKEKLNLIFDRFYQVKEKPAKGFGLGLYITREIIKAHKGRISVKSIPGKGSTFSFTIHSI